MALNPKQQRFVEEYLCDLNATQAAIRAGYSERTAYSQGQRLLKHAEVQKAIIEGQQKRAERVELSQDWVLARLIENVERSMQAEPVLDSDGIPTGEYKYAGNWANKALELLGKHLGMFVERHEVTGKGGGPIETRSELAGLSVEELLQRRAKLLSEGE